MNLDVAVSKTEMSYSPDPTAKPVFDPPEVIPSLGTGATSRPPLPA